MNRSFLPGLLVCVLLAASACGTLPARGDPGVGAVVTLQQDYYAICNHSIGNPL